MRKVDFELITENRKSVYFFEYQLRNDDDFKITVVMKNNDTRIQQKMFKLITQNQIRQVDPLTLEQCSIILSGCFKV